MMGMALRKAQRLVWPRRLVKSLKTGNVFREALPLVKPLEAEPPRMGSHAPGF